MKDRWQVHAIGRMSDPQARAAIEDYRKRTPGLCVFEHGGRDQSRESAQLLAKTEGCLRVVLDEKGKVMTSARFAALLSELPARKPGAPIAFLLGGADGHSPEVKAAADVMLSLSAMTLPHMLARLMLVEQLYRAHTIHTGHPYHRAG